MVHGDSLPALRYGTLTSPAALLVASSGSYLTVVAADECPIQRLRQQPARVGTNDRCGNNTGRRIWQGGRHTEPQRNGPLQKAPLQCTMNADRPQHPPTCPPGDLPMPIVPAATMNPAKQTKILLVHAARFGLSTSMFRSFFDP
jgi:hypothetical protein